MRMPKTSEAVSLFLGSLMGTMKRGEVGAESNRIFVPLDSTRNLKLRLGMRDVLQKRFLGGQGRGLQLTTKQTFALKKAAWDGGQVTDDEARFLLEVGMDARNFESTTDGELTREGKLARFDLLRFAHANLADIDPAVLKTVGAGKEASAARAANAEVMMEWRDGAFAQFARSGEASEAEVQAARKQAGNVRATASVAALPVKSSAQQIMAAFLRQSEEIGGWNWLEWVPEDEPHPMLIKPGINWGINGYPSVTSWEACYGAALGTLEKAAAKNKNVPVTIADESGIENKDFGRTTMDNMEDTNILGAGIFAGIENHYRKQGLSNAEAHQQALNHVHRAMIDRERTYRDDTKREIPASPKIEDLVPLINRHDADLIALAKEGGVEVLPLDEGPTVILKPVVARRGMKLKENEIPVTRQQYDSMKHFKDGIRVNAHLLKFKKMINLPKPPGRHGIMSNCGLTGANKNHIGLLAGVDRGVVLHNKFARVPKPRDGEDYGTFTERIEQAVRWMGTGAVNLKGLEDEGRLTEEKMNGFDWEAHYDDMVDTGEQWIHHLSSEAQALADEGKGQQAGGPGQGFFDKLGELELFFKHMTAFTWTDMRQTVSSCGPDFGEQVDVGVSIASDNASVVDAYATAALKQVYDRGRNAEGEFTDLPSQFEELAKLGDVSQMSFLGRLGFFRTKFQARMRKSVSELYESMQGKRFLTRGRPERLKTWVGAMKMGLAPTDMKGVVLKSGGELIDTDYLGDKTPGRL